MMTILRELNPETDYPDLSALRDACGEEPVTVETFRERDASWPDDGIRRRIVAEAEGQMVGYGSAARFSYFRQGDFRLSILVHPSCRRQGIGARLYEALSVFLAGLPTRRLSTRVRDDCADCLHFAEQRGFKVTEHEYESVLRIADFDETPYRGLLDHLRAEGLRFFSLADCLTGPEDEAAAKRKLYDLNTEAVQDIPGFDQEMLRPFEQFTRDVFEAGWFRPDGQIVAAEGDLWVGLAAVGETAPGTMYNMHTGVRRAYRGHKIAQGLKLLAIEFCRKHNAQTIRTNNNARNGAMLAINRKMGYVPEAGIYILKNEMDETGEPNRWSD